MESPRRRYPRSVSTGIGGVMHWINSTLMAWSFRSGYWFQPFFEGANDGVDWMTWCGGGPLDNEASK